MKISSFKRVLILLLCILAFIFGPYLWSRIFSEQNRISIHQLEGPVDTQSSANGNIRIACYNIAHGRGLPFDNWNGESKQQRLERLDKLAELLKLMDADVIALNEVDFNSSWSHGINQAKYLAEHAGYAYRAEERNLDFRVAAMSWCFGNAVLSKYPIVNAEVIDLPEYKSWETSLAGKKRGLRATINPGSRNIAVAAVHFSHRSEAIRVASAQMLIDLAKVSKHPFFIAGDLNSTPGGFPGSGSSPAGENALDVFDGASLFNRSPVGKPDGRHFTFPSDKPKSVIDWVLIPSRYRFVEYQVIQSMLSDHLPVISTIEFRPESG